MGLSVAQTYLSDILHVISQALLVPVIILLLLFIAYALYCIGSIISEYFAERRHFKVVMPKFLAALMSAKQGEIPQVVNESGLLKRQKTALLTVYDYRSLPGDALIALIRRLVSEEESRYDRIRSRNNMAARISPMIGLMGTLIPLGPGIEALGRADTAALSSSLLIAFDTTVAGLVVAAVCLAVGKIRSNWYDNYLSALDAGMATMLEKIETMRNAGEITTEEPSDYAFLYGSAPDKKAEKAPSAKKKGEKPGQPQATTEPAGQAAPASAFPVPASVTRAMQQSEAERAAAKEAAAATPAAGYTVSSIVDAAINGEPASIADEPAIPMGEAKATSPEFDFHFEPPRQPWE